MARNKQNPKNISLSLNDDLTYGVESRMTFFDEMIPPSSPNVYTDTETREEVFFWEEVDTPDGPELKCLGWSKREHFSDRAIDVIRDELRWYWCVENDNEAGGIDHTTALLKQAYKEEGLH